jgi:hypothetical protein
MRGLKVGVRLDLLLRENSLRTSLAVAERIMEVTPHHGGSKVGGRASRSARSEFSAKSRAGLPNEFSIFFEK